MSKPGNYAAYQQYKPLDNGTIQAIQHWSSFAEQKRQNDIANEQREKEFEYKVEKDKKDQRNDWLKYDGVPATGVKNFDTFSADSLSLGKRELFNAVEEHERLPKDDPKKLQLEFKIARLQKLPSDFKNLTTANLKLAQEYYANPDKWVRDPEIDNFLSNLENAEFTINDIGESAIRVKDPNNPNKTKAITIEEAMSENGIVQLTPMFQWDKLIKDNAAILNKNVPTKETKDPNNPYIITTESGYNPDTIKEIAKNIFIDQNRNPTIHSVSFLKQKGIYEDEQLKDPANLDELIKQFANDITLFLTSSQEEKFDKDQADYDLKLQKEKNDTNIDYAKINLAKQKLALDRDKAIDTGDVKPTIDKTSFTALTKDQSDIVRKGYRGFGVKKNNLIISNKKEKKQEVVTQIWINPKNPNEVIIRGYSTENKMQLDGNEQEIREDFRYDSTKNPGKVLRFTSQANMDINQLHELLSDVGGIEETPQTKEKPQPKAEDLRIKYDY